MEKEQQPTEQSAINIIASEAFYAFLAGYSPFRADDMQQEIHRSTQEVCNIISDTLDIPRVAMAELLQGAGFKLCIDHDGRVKWKLFKNISFEDEG